MTLDLEFDHYALFVDDLTRSAEFYGSVLGLKEIAEPFRDGLHRWFSVGGNQQLHLITPRSGATPPGADVHFAFRVAALEDFVARLESLKIPYGDQRTQSKVHVRPDGIRQVYFQDPDGYWIEVNEAKYEGA